MNSQSPRRLRGIPAAIIVAALLIIAGFFASSYFETAMTTTRTSTVTTTATRTTTTSTTIVSTLSVNEGPLLYASGVSPDGLQLKVTLNSSIIQTRAAVSAKIELFNTLSLNVTLRIVSKENFSEWNGNDFVCSGNPTGSLLSFAVFKGHFSASNLSAAGSPLRLAPPLFPPCPMRIPPTDATFLPNSDRAITRPYHDQVRTELNATTGSCVSSGFSVNCGASSGLVGYWNLSISPSGNLNFTSPAFVYFPTGEYTIVAADDWNQYVYAYFTVL